MSDLKTCFAYHRLLGKPATRALELARLDVAAGKARYASSNIYPAVSWQDERVGNLPFPQYKRRIAHIDEPAKAGLRFVGRVMVEPSYRNGYWDKHERCGWFTYPNGETFKDGTGLCYGVVYQLPGKNGKSRFVPGYQFGGVDGGPTLELSNIFEDVAPGNAWDVNPCDYDAARECARYADGMAQAAAEKERAYQAAWQAGSRYAELSEEVKGTRRSIIEAIKELKAARAALNNDQSKYGTLCGIVRSEVESMLADISKARQTMEKLKSGDYVSEWLPGFYPSEELQAAFNEGANI